MMEFESCKCNANIDETFEIQSIWRGMEHDVFVAYCKYCLEVAPFKVQAPYDSKMVTKQAAEAWNKRSLQN